LSPRSPNLRPALPNRLRARPRPRLTSQVQAKPSKTKQNQTEPNRTKQNQTEPSKIAWFYLVLFVGIGTFQWVTANPSKKSCPPVTLCPKSRNQALSVSSRRRRFESDKCAAIAQISSFGNQQPRFLIHGVRRFCPGARRALGAADSPTLDQKSGPRSRCA
jgi:hypothetical protein